MGSGIDNDASGGGTMASFNSSLNKVGGAVHQMSGRLDGHGVVMVIVCCFELLFAFY